MNDASLLNESRAAKAFSKQSLVFDEMYSSNSIVQYKRERVRKHFQQFAKPGAAILELNAGTGEDAVYFAGMGFSIHATDIASGMQEKLAEKISRLHLTKNISQEICSYTSLEKLKNKGPYDHIFSNFAGLNCTDELEKVLLSFNPLLKPGGIITLVVLPPFCLWEFLLILKGKWKTALRRFAGKKGARSHVEGEYFTCWYYSPSYIRKLLKKDFLHLKTEGLCTVVPPSYIEGFAEKFPVLFKWLCKTEGFVKTSWPFCSMGDYYIISFQKKL